MFKSYEITFGTPAGDEGKKKGFEFMLESKQSGITTPEENRLQLNNVRGDEMERIFNLAQHYGLILISFAKEPEEQQ